MREWAVSTEGISDCWSIWGNSPNDFSFKELEAFYDTIKYYPASATAMKMSIYSVDTNALLSALTIDSVRALLYQNAGKKMSKSKSILKNLEKSKEISTDAKDQIKAQLDKLKEGHTH